MLRVDLEPQDRAGREMLIAAEALLQVLHRNRQLLNRQVARVPHRDQRAAFGDELLEVLDAGLANAASIFRADRRRVEAVDDGARDPDPRR